MSASAIHSNDLRQVKLKSREDQEVQVPARDVEFLKLADKFVIDARRVAKDPKRKKPRLRFR